ncbi:hypothetical protein SAMN04487906_2199 [Zhouia amylolytica]|nr:hypothetical protein [Zhouia amylolytica]MCQ0111041.1 hypothetical protein [Zhouia amylolytica]SFS93624.1 hypothetical protein SAMN04487906_2199 [Zhouia amylolytica]
MKALKIIGAVILGVTLVALYVFVIMHLWNWLIPDMFGVTSITYWQAAGLLLLFKLLFLGNGWRCNKDESSKDDEAYKAHWKSNFRQRWEEKCKTQQQNNDE